MTTGKPPDHGTVYVPCIPLGTITTTRCDTTQHGTIAAIDLGGGVGVHIHTADAARELLAAALEALFILDPHGALADILDDDCEEEPEVVMYGGAPLDVARAWNMPVSVFTLPKATLPGEIPVPYYPAGLTPVCSDCGSADPVSVSEDGKCWNSQHCDERQVRNAGDGLGAS